MADFLEGGEADIKEVTEQSIKKKEDELYNVGYNDGLTKGYERQFQSGFNDGFKEGDAFGKCVGIINASIKILDLCFNNSKVEDETRNSFIRWRKDIESYLIPPQLELTQSEYDVIKAEKLGLIMTRLKDLFAALNMKECVMMKLLETISIYYFCYYIFLHFFGSIPSFIAT